MSRQRLTAQVLYATFVACLGSVQYGYHTAELNAPQQVMTCSEFRIPRENLPYERTWLGKHNFDQCVPLDDEQFGVVTAVFSLGGIAGSYYAAGLADRYGRRAVAFYTSLLSFGGSLLLFASNSYRDLIMGRMIVGVGSGAAIVVTPLLINEIAPTDWRGALGSLNQLFINLGILLTQSLALRFADSYRWRWLLLTGAVVAATNFLMLLLVSESPKWLALQGRAAEAEAALCRLRGSASSLDAQDIRHEVEDWQREMPDHEHAEQTSGPSLWQYFTDPVYRKPRHVITATLTGQQLCGINSIVFYGVKVVGQLLPEHAVQVNFAVSILNVLMTLGASLVIDRFGPKRLLQWSTATMSAAAFVISVAITSRRAALLVSAILVYIGAFALGLGPVPFLLIGQLSAPRDAATAQSYGTICNWLATAGVAYGFPLANGLLGGYVYLLFAAAAALFAVYASQRIPDTRRRAGYEQLWAGT